MPMVESATSVSMSASSTAPSAAPPPSAPKPASACTPLAAGTIRLVDTTPHTALRFVALVRNASVIAVGAPQPGSPCEKGCRDLELKGSAAQAFSAIGFSTKRIGSLIVASSLADQAGVRSGGKNVDFDLERVASRDVYSLLGDVTHLEVEGAPSTLVTIEVRNAPALTVMSALTIALGGKLTIDGSHAELGSLPAEPEVAAFDEPQCPFVRSEISVIHECRDIASLRVIALARSGDRIEAFVTASAKGHARLAGVGDWIGPARIVGGARAEPQMMENRKVVSIACDGLRLDDGTHVPLVDVPRL